MAFARPKRWPTRATALRLRRLDFGRVRSTTPAWPARPLAFFFFSSRRSVTLPNVALASPPVKRSPNVPSKCLSGEKPLPNSPDRAQATRPLRMRSSAVRVGHLYPRRRSPPDCVQALGQTPLRSVRLLRVLSIAVRRYLPGTQVAPLDAASSVSRGSFSPIVRVRAQGQWGGHER